MGKHLHYGADYNPEQWPRAVWERWPLPRRQAGRVRPVAEGRRSRDSGRDGRAPLRR